MPTFDYIPEEIKLPSNANHLQIKFKNEQTFNLPFEYLRVHSPSAEVRGHGLEQSKLVLNKQNIKIKKIEPVGHYAVKLLFDDGHASGLYTWEYLYELSINQDRYWQQYLRRVQEYEKAANHISTDHHNT